MPPDPGLAHPAPDVEFDLTQIQHSHLYNADLAPVPHAQRRWGLLSFAALWISMSACIPTYMLPSSLIGGAHVPPFLLGLYHYAWFVGFGVAFVVYLALRKLAPNS